jgi:catechol 2,3-dioxygenase-like lactoylglutathione lyase family enzyme
LIPARDVEEAIRFYRDALGFELDYRDAEPARFAIVGGDSASLNLFANGDETWPTRPACASSSMASTRCTSAARPALLHGQ